MLIHCPNCQTQYDVESSGLGPNGRTVRCYYCGNQWLQQSVANPAPAQAVQQPAPPPPAAAQYPGYPGQMPGYPPYPQQGYPYPPPGYPPVPGYPPPPGYPPQSDVAAESAPAPVTEPTPEMEPEAEKINDEDLDTALSANINALFESDDDEAEEEAPEPNPEPEDDLSEEELETIFEDEEEPTAIPSIVDTSSNGDEADNVISIDEIENIPDPDPLPDSLTSDIRDMDDDPDEAPAPRRRKRLAKPPKKSKSGIYIILILLILLPALAGGMYFMRDLIIQYVPAMSIIYDTIGISAEELGEGLTIEDINSQRITTGGVDYLIVTGNINNSTDHEVSVPLIKAILSNAEEEQIQSVVQEPSKPAIMAKDTIGFRIEIEEPSPLARRLNVVFMPRPKSDGEAGQGEESGHGEEE